MTSRPAAVMVTRTLRRSSSEAVLVTSPRSAARSTRPVTLDLSSCRNVASSPIVGCRSRTMPSSRAAAIDRPCGGRDPAQRALDGECQLGERVHQAQVPLARQRGEDGAAVRAGYVIDCGHAHRVYAHFSLLYHL